MPKKKNTQERSEFAADNTEAWLTPRIDIESPGQGTIMSQPNTLLECR